MANTTNFAVEKPTVGGYRNSWGGTLNVALDKVTELLALALPIGTIQIYTKATAPTATTNGGTWLVCDGSTKVRTDYPELHTLITNTFGAYPSASTFVLPDLRTRVPVGYSSATVGSGASQRTPKAIAASSGEESHQLTVNELMQHSHAIPNTTHSHAIEDQTHTHVGAETGGKTATATTGITSSPHHHPLPRRASWGDGNYDTGFVNGGGDAATTTGEATVVINDSGHAHSFSTTAVATGITTTQAGLTNITSTENTGTTDTPHNNMQPYLVLNYIILAKHPTF